MFGIMSSIRSLLWLAGAVAVTVFIPIGGAGAQGSAGCDSWFVVRNHANNPDLVADCEALLASKNQLIGQNGPTDGPTALNWSKWIPIGQWTGVTVDSGKVVSINLARAELSGSIPPQLGDLTGVHTLILRGNELTGSIPTELENMTKLRILELQNNQLTGSIPKFIANLKNLRTLKLHNNELTGSIPIKVGNRFKLRTVNLSNNQLTGTIPTRIAQMTSLRVLDLSNNQLTGTIPDTPMHMTNLHKLVISGNQLEGPIPSSLGNLVSLQTVDLNNNQFTGSLPMTFNKLTDIRYLDLSDNKLRGIPRLSNLQLLNHLDLSNNRFRTSLEIDNLPSLQYLDASNNDFDSQLPEQLSTFGKLRTIRLHGNRFYGSIPRSLNQLTMLKHLWLFDNELTGSIPRELSNLQHLEQLWLNHNLLIGTFSPQVGRQSSLNQFYAFDNSVLILNSSVDEPIQRTLTEKHRPGDRVGDPIAGSQPEPDFEMVYSQDNLFSIDSAGQIYVKRTNTIEFADNRSYALVVANRTTSQHIMVQIIKGPYIPCQESIHGSLLNECKLLRRAKHTLIGSGDPDLLNWSPSTHLRNWNGIELESDRLVGLNLHNMGLTGEVPAELGDLSSLKRLNLSKNHLTGTIPASLGQLDSLEILSLYSNQLTGPIPEELAKLNVNLDEMLLFDNQLTGKIPLKIWEMSKLKSLMVFDNELLISLNLFSRDLIIPLLEIKYFWINSNKLRDIFPPKYYNFSVDQMISFDSDVRYEGGLGPPSRQLKVAFDAPPGTPIGNPIVASDFSNSEFAQIYSRDDLFEIDSSGQIRTRTKIDHIDPDRAYYVVAQAVQASNNPKTTESEYIMVQITPGKTTSPHTKPSESDTETQDSDTTDNTDADTTDDTDTDNTDADDEVPGPCTTDSVIANWADKPGLVSDCNALLFGKDTLIGRGNTAALNWSTTIPFTSWTGVTIQSGRVTKLRLSYKALAGQIPVSLGDLTNLQGLYLHGNRLAGFVPDALGNLSKLQYLYLFDNRLYGKIPEEFGNLTDLRHLWLHDNQLSGSIPEELSRLMKLELLWLFDNQLTGSIPDSFTELRSLRQLWLNNNQLAGDISQRFWLRNRLDEFHLFDNPNLVLPSLRVEDKNLFIEIQAPSAVNRGAIIANLPSPGNKTYSLIYSQDGIFRINPNGQVTSTRTTQIQPGRSYIAIGLDNNTHRYVMTRITTAPQPTTQETETSETDTDDEDPSPCATDSVIADWADKPGLVSDCNILLAGKDKLIVVGDTTALNWSTTIPITNWTGVTIQSDRVTQLGLAYKTLTGTIPESLGNLTNLQRLDLRGNRLYGSIPDTLGDLTNLQYLYLFKNQLTGEIPEELGNLGELQFLYLFDNQLTGEIPEELGNLTKLIHLYLHQNQLAGSIPTEFGNLTKLRHIHLHQNQLSGQIPAALGNLTNLKQLWLFDNQLSGQIPAALGNLTNLRSLYLYNNQLSGQIPAELSRLTRLKLLWLHGNQLSGQIPAELSRLTRLKQLWLNNNQLTGSIPESLAELGNLEQLWLNNNQLTGTVPPGFTSQSSLQELYIFDNNLDATPTELIPKTTSFQQIWLPDAVENGTDVGDRLPGSGYRLDYSQGNAFEISHDGQITARTAITSDTPYVMVVSKTSEHESQSNKFLMVRLTTVPQPTTENSDTTNSDATDTDGTEPQDSDADDTDTDDDTGADGRDPGPCAADSVIADWASKPGLVSDCNALLAGKDTLIGGGNTTALNWSTTIPVTSWTGVTIQSDRVTKLRLSYKALTGTIPESLGDLTSIQGLYLHGNRLTGEIPEELGNLSKLQYLYLFDNRLYGEIPEELGNLTDLRHLWLHANQLSGSMPEEFSGLMKLELLWLFDNQLTGSIPDSFTELRSLRQLWLNNNQLTGGISHIFWFRNRLDEFHLFDNLNLVLPSLRVEDKNLFIEIQPPAAIERGAIIGTLPSPGNKTYSLIYSQDGIFRINPNGQVTSTRTTQIQPGHSYIAIGLDNNTHRYVMTRITTAPQPTTQETETQDTDPPDSDADGGDPGPCATDSVIADWADKPDLVSDCNALLAAKDTMIGEGNTAALNWSTTTPITNWTGVTIQSDRVTQLRLSYKTLTGTVPESLGNLTNLQRLDLRGNRLTGEIPAALGDLTNLQYLYLFKNQLSGEIPAELGNLGELQFLYLFDNQLSGEITAELGNLSKLIHLYLHQNQLSGEITAELGNLTSLRNLSLYNNQLSGSIPTELGNLGELRNLHLHKNQLSGEIPVSLGNLTKLEQLTLAENQLSGEIPASLGNLKKLERLWLHANQLSGSIPSELSGMTNLRMLWLFGNQLTGSIPEGLDGIDHFKQLWLNNNQLSGDIPSLMFVGHDAIEGFYTFANPDLEVGWRPETASYRRLLLPDNMEQGTNLGRVRSGATYSLVYSESDALGINSVGQVTALRSLTPEPGRSYIMVVKENNGYRMIRLIPELTHCEGGGRDAGPTRPPDLLSDCRALLDSLIPLEGRNSGRWSPYEPLAAWEGVTIRSGRVTELNLTSKRLTGTIPAALSKLTALETLRLSYNQLTGQIPAELGNLRNLKRLWLHGNRLTGQIPAELGNLTSLRNLSLYNNQLTGQIPAELSRLTNLQQLWLNGNQLTGQIPAELSRLRNLNHLWLFNNRLTGSIPESLAELGNLEQLWLNDNQLTGTVPTGFADQESLQELYVFNNPDLGSLPAALSNKKTTPIQRKAPIAVVRGRTIPNPLDNPTGGKYYLIYSQEGIIGINPSGQLKGTKTQQLTRTQTYTMVVSIYNKYIMVQITPAGGICENNVVIKDPLQKPGLVKDCETLLAAKDDLMGAAGRVPWYEILGPPLEDWSPNIPITSWPGVTVRSDRVTKLKLNGLNLSRRLEGKIPAVLGDLDALEYMTIVHNLLRGPIPESLGNLKNLQGLELPNNDSLTGPIPESLGKLKNLNHLKLYHNKITGPIPESLGNLTELRHLWLQNNRLTGSIPESFGKLKKLKLMWLNNNRLEGPIPQQLTSLPYLEQLWINENQITGTIPSGFANQASLKELYYFENPGLEPPPSGLGQKKTVPLQRTTPRQFGYGAYIASLPTLAGNAKYVFISSDPFFMFSDGDGTIFGSPPGFTLDPDRTYSMIGSAGGTYFMVQFTVS